MKTECEWQQSMATFVGLVFAGLLCCDNICCMCVAAAAADDDDVDDVDDDDVYDNRGRWSPVTTGWRQSLPRTFDLCSQTVTDTTRQAATLLPWLGSCRYCSSLAISSSRHSVCCYLLLLTGNNIIYWYSVSFSALMLLVGCQEGYRAFEPIKFCHKSLLLGTGLTWSNLTWC